MGPMKWPSSRSVALVWLLAALSLIGWLIVNLDTAGWLILTLTVGLMAFALTRRRDGAGAPPTPPLPAEPTGQPAGPRPRPPTWPGPTAAPPLSAPRARA